VIGLYGDGPTFSRPAGGGLTAPLLNAATSAAMGNKNKITAKEGQNFLSGK